ncbi:MAG TPA: PEGA domain-containing protein, partial [Polyangia bacterium]|nr:PEGA domain-containing protein [Polyangia bacterium]
SLPPPPPSAPTGEARLRKSFPPVVLPPPPVSLAPVPLVPAPPPPPQPRLQPTAVRPAYQPPPTAAPFGTGNFADEVSRSRPKRGGLYAALAVLVVAGAAGGFWYRSTTNRPGRIELSTVPADAVVLIDNAKVGDHSPISLERPPGPYTLSVTRDGYVRSDQNIELKAGEPLPLSVTLEPSPDTGFELTSEPPGGLVWLDGAPIKGASGQQARTDFRAFRIAPGHHVLEIKGENRFKPWRQEVEVDPGSIRKVHAMLIPAGGESSSSKPAAHPEVAAATPPPEPGAPPPPPSTRPSAPEASAVSPAHHAGGGSSSAGRHKKPHEAAAAADGAQASADDGDKESAAPAATGGDCTMTVNSTPWSEVWIDGKNTTKHTPFVDYKIPCGKHRLAFKRSDMQIDYSENITIHPGEKFKQRYTLPTDE